MMVLTIIMSVLSVLVIILGFTTFNLLKKQEKAEDVLVEYLTYLDTLSRVIEASDKKLKEIDSKETFKSDDEVGFFFKSIQQIQDILNEFKVIRMKE
jgi:hypothetical protein